MSDKNSAERLREAAEKALVAKVERDDLIARAHYDDHLTMRRIAEITNLPKSTINDILKRQHQLRYERDFERVTALLRGADTDPA